LAENDIHLLIGMVVALPVNRKDGKGVTVILIFHVTDGVGRHTPGVNGNFRLAAGLWFSLMAATTLARATPSSFVDDNLAQAALDYRRLLDELRGTAGLPRTFERGRLVTVPASDWTSGFFPGCLWLLYEGTGEAQWRGAAERYTILLEAEQHDKSTHDIGFMLGSSYGNGWRLTGTPHYRTVLLNGAEALATRFNPRVGCIKSWDHDRRWDYPVIIDNLMNLDLLLWASRDSGNRRFREIAESHGEITLRNQFRPDGSAYHVVAYDPADGRVVARATDQGAAAGSAWARGQSWALYGCVTLYRETHRQEFLDQARKTAAFLMHHPRMPADKVPYWDYDAPAIPHAPRDASAAAIMCSALFELARLDPGATADYAGFAESQLRSLASPAYRSAPGHFLLNHSTGAFPHGTEIDVPIIYGDYYFLEALLRSRTRSDPVPPGDRT
jgi:unsaturated chondroitin disaccharide hydrolase